MIAPGFIETPMTEEFDGVGKDKIKAEIPLLTDWGTERCCESDSVSRRG